MENFMIKIYNSGKPKPEQTITIPLAKLKTGAQLLPAKAKELLQREDIDITRVSDLAAKSISKGILIEIENETNRIVMAVE